MAFSLVKDSKIFFFCFAVGKKGGMETKIFVYTVFPHILPQHQGREQCVPVQQMDPEILVPLMQVQTSFPRRQVFFSFEHGLITVILVSYGESVYHVFSFCKQGLVTQQGWEGQEGNFRYTEGGKQRGVERVRGNSRCKEGLGEAKKDDGA